MSLKITRGVANLAHLPRRVKVIAVLFLGIMAVVTMLSESGSMAAIGGATGRPSQVTTPGSSQAADDVALRKDSVSKEIEAAPSDPGKTAKIVTCPRCRLSALPLVKKFVYDHAKLFEPQLKIDFIVGEDPVLHLYDDEREVSKIPLETYDWKQIIRKLVEFGIKPKSITPEVREALESAQ